MRPYAIAVHDSAISSLQERLANATPPEDLFDSHDDWRFGVPSSEIRRLVQHWRQGFSWRRVEAELNELPHFRTSIDVANFGDLDIHFVHQRSKDPGAIPLLFCHGWPGSFLEVRKLLSLLPVANDVKHVSFHIVAPSLPNFGFSQGVSKPGFGLREYATVCHKLMLQLGYKQYVTQGGDWGFHITRTMGLLFPESGKASHLNVSECFPPSLLQHPILWLQDKLLPRTAHEKAGLERTAEHQRDGMGYDILQSTRPQALAYALSADPVFLLSWIYEKLVLWTDNYPWTDDEILTWVSLYWFSTAGPAASIRIYYEANHADVAAGGISYDRPKQWIPLVKYGVSSFPRDLTVNPNPWVATLGDVVLHTRQPHGGHFAAVECPEAIARDLQAMFAPRGPCYGLLSH